MDEKFSFNGNDDGVRKTKKYWNSLRSQPVMKYAPLPNGSFDFGLQNSPDSQHIYMVDIYSYGLEGLDSMIPSPNSQGAPSGSAMGGMPEKKRQKSGETVMSGTSDASFGTSGLQNGLLNPMTEDRESWVKIVTEMKLYYRQAPS